MNNYETKFYTEGKAKSAYNADFTVTSATEKPVDLAWNGLTFARGYADGTKESFFKADKGLPFEETLAAKLLNDPEVRTGTKSGFVERDGEMIAVTDHILPCRNPESVVFQPTVFEPVSNAVNVDTDFALEILFAMDDGYFFPYVKTFKTGGSFAISVADAIHDTLSDWDFGGIFEELAENCPNVIKDEYGYHILVSNAEGILDQFDYEDPGTPEEHELMRSIVSMRLVKLNAVIK